MHKPTQCICLMGPTASGKSRLALTLAHLLPVEIISVDSALIYRDMNIGTAKPGQAALQRVPHHLIDILDPSQSYSAAQFRADTLKLIDAILQRNKIPLLVGGTMLYFKALREGLDELPNANPEIRKQIETQAKQQGWPQLHAKLMRVDPETAQRLKVNDAQRIQRALEIYEVSGKPMSALLQQNNYTFPYSVIPIGLIPSKREVLHQHIADRFDQMLTYGLIDEVIALQKKYPLSPDLPSMRCVGYRQVWEYLEGKLDKTMLREKGIVATRQLAKRQLTWMRAMPDIAVFDCLADDVHRHILTYLQDYFEGIA